MKRQANNYHIFSLSRARKVVLKGEKIIFKTGSRSLFYKEVTKFALTYFAVIMEKQICCVH